MDVDFGDIQNPSGGGGGASGSGGNGGGGDDITSDLLQKFSCMNTNDREVLIQQFKVLLGEKCSETNAEFWLDMNNWNLQAAVCSYFDYESQNSSYPFPIKLPSMSFLSDTNFADRMPPNTPFIYHCVVTNSGDEMWPLGCSLRFCGGTQMSNEERVLLPSLNPGQAAEVKLSMISPDSAGGHQCQWRPATLTGQFFGETIFIIVNVIDDGLQSVTQQLCDAHLMDSSNSGPATVPRPDLSSLPLSTSTIIPLPISININNNPLQQQQPSPGLVAMADSNSFNLVSSLSSSYPSATSSNHISFVPGSPPNHFTPGMCLPGSTAAGFLPGGEAGPRPQVLSSSLQNGMLFDHQAQAQHLQHQLQQVQQPQPPLMLTHLSASQIDSGRLSMTLSPATPPPPPPSAAASHESVDDSTMS